MISHEIRTPMNAIVGLTNVLLNTVLAQQQRDLLQTIRTSGDALLTIINDILDFSKIESGKLQLEHQPFDVQDCVQAAIALLIQKAAEKGLTVKFQTQPLPTIVGDKTRLRQILVNLISNAIKFTARGEIGISIVTRCDKQSDPPSIELEFAVSDTGIGISLTQRDRLFQSFGQADSSIAAQYGGTGLGLAISKQLCELMNGRIWVDSEIGRGSTFYFTIVAPIAEPASDQGAVSESIIVTNQKLTDFALQYPLRILVAEDNQINQKVISLMLQQLGYQIDLVENGLKAVEAVRHQSYDVVLMDIQMPQVDGLAATEQICQAWNASQRPRIIAMTAFASSEDRSRCFAAGMDDYITKPIQMERLIQSLVAVKPQLIHAQHRPTEKSSEPINAAAIAAVQALADGSAEFVVEIIDCYFEEASKLIESMRRFLNQQDLKSLRRSAHTLNSTSATLGAARLAQLCAAIEVTTMQSKIAHVSEQIDQIEIEYQRVKAALQQERQKYC